MTTPHVLQRRPWAVISVIIAVVFGLLISAQPASAATPGQITIGAKCLDDRNSSTQDGNIIQLFSCNGASAQSWTLSSDGTVRVLGKCLSISGQAVANGTVVELWSCVSSGSDQKWVALPNGTISNLKSGKCLSVTGQAMVDGARLELQPCQPSAAFQQWTVPATDPPAIAAISTQTSTVGVATGLTPSATGGVGRVDWTATNLPDGLLINYATGMVMGTPRTAGSWTTTLTATDSRLHASSITFTWTVQASAVGTAWYVDCGAASNGSGTSTSPWNSLGGPNGHTFAPGDQLLLKRGTTCSGRLFPQGNGSASAPITITGYGSGAKPIIAGGAVAESAVLLQNQSYWIVDGLEVTNSSATEARRSGILVTINSAATYSGITIRNNDVHDVMGVSDRGADANGFYMSHGIGLNVPLDGALMAGLTISDNYVHDMRGNGIGLYGTDGSNTNVVKNRYVLAQGNKVVRNSNDGIVVCGTDSPLIDHNISDGAGTNAINPQNIAAIWAWNDDNPTFQYNEAMNLVAHTFDSEAWDCDGYITGRCTYQYNYDHNNYGGILLDCVGCGGGKPTSIVYRYNVSVGDCRVVDNSGNLTDFAFYNNTIDCGSASPDLGFASLTYLANNIFIGPSGASMPNNAYYSNNVYRGFTPPSDLFASTADPKIIAQGTAATGYQTVGGYQIASGSSGANNGIAVANPPAVDYWSNVISTTVPNRGAFGGSPLGAATFTDDSSSSISYSGPWTVENVAASRNGSDHVAGSTTATAAFSFSGRHLSIWATQAPDGGLIRVVIDGTVVADASLYAVSAAPGTRVYTSPQLLSGSHTVTLSVSPASDPRSSGSKVTFDGLEVRP